LAHVVALGQDDSCQIQLSLFWGENEAGSGRSDGQSAVDFLWLDDPIVATVIDCVVHSSEEYVIKKTEICNDIHQSLHVQDISW